MCSGCFKEDPFASEEEEEKVVTVPPPRPGNHQAGRRSGAQVATPPVFGTSQSALFPLRAATLGLVTPVCLAQVFQSHVSSSHTRPTDTPYRARDERCTTGFGSPLNTHFGQVGGPWCCAALRYSFALFT